MTNVNFWHRFVSSDSVFWTELLKDMNMAKQFLLIENLVVASPLIFSKPEKTL